MRTCAESTVGIEEAPGSVNLIASTMLTMVDAVPMVLQVPIERVIRLSRSIQSASVMLPACFSSQYLRVWVLAPTTVPRYFPFDIGQAGRRVLGCPC